MKRINNEMFIRKAEGKDLLNLLLLYVPKENNFPAENIFTDEGELRRTLDASLAHPEYNFYVVEYLFEIVAAYGIRNVASGAANDFSPIISDLKIADKVKNIIKVNDIVEHAVFNDHPADLSKNSDNRCLGVCREAQLRPCY